MKESAKVCSTCGEPIPDDAFKCPHCGAANPKGDKKVSGKRSFVIYESFGKSLGRLLAKLPTAQVGVLGCAAIALLAAYLCDTRLFSILLLFPL